MPSVPPTDPPGAHEHAGADAAASHAHGPRASRAGDRATGSQPVADSEGTHRPADRSPQPSGATTSPDSATPASPPDHQSAPATEGDADDAAGADGAEQAPHPVELTDAYDGDADRAGRPGALPRVGIVLIVLASAWLAVTAARNLQGIIAPLLLTLNLVIVAYPVQAKLNKLGLPRIIGACVTGLIVFAIVLSFFAALAWSMAMLVQEIPGYQAQFSTLYQQSLDQLARIGVSETQAMSQLQAQLNPSRIVGFVASTLSGLTGAMTMMLVTVTIIFVVLIDSMDFGRRLEIANRTHDDIVAALMGFARGVRRYWIVSSIFGAIVAALDVVALMQLGVPLALVWGLLSFLTNYIPNIGFVLGIVPPALMALLANGPQTALLVIIAYCVINFVIQSIIMPKYLGDAVGVTATVSLLSLLFWAWVLGPMGALLALPATLLCKALLIDLDPRMRWLDAFVSSHPETGSHLTQSGSQRTLRKVGG